RRERRREVDLEACCQRERVRERGAAEAAPRVRVDAVPRRERRRALTPERGRPRVRRRGWAGRAWTGGRLGAWRRRRVALGLGCHILRPLPLDRDAELRAQRHALGREEVDLLLQARHDAFEAELAPAEADARRRFLRARDGGKDELLDLFDE